MADVEDDASARAVAVTKGADEQQPAGQAEDPTEPLVGRAEGSADGQLQTASAPPASFCARFVERARKISHMQLTLLMLLSWFTCGLYMYTSRTWGGKWYTIIDSLYVMAQIITTVGYGDLTPTKPGGHAFTTVFITVAVVVFSNIIASIAEAVDEMHDRAMATMNRATKKVERRLSQMGGIDAPIEGESSSSASPPAAKRGLLHRCYIGAAKADFVAALGYWFACVLIGTVFFHLYPGEQRHISAAFYMSVITLTTVGFGDETAHTQTGRLFAAIWMLVGVSLFANMVAKFTIAFASHRVKELDITVLNNIWSSHIYRHCNPETLDSDPSENRVSRADFVVYMATEMGLLETSTLDALLQDFADLDVDGSGRLDRKDLEPDVLNQMYADTDGDGYSPLEVVPLSSDENQADSAA